jgi:hypothetical protein
MTPAKAMARANKIFMVQVSLMIVTYDSQNSFIVLAPGPKIVPKMKLIINRWNSSGRCYKTFLAFVI